jgi:hypothetical protein
MAERPRRVAHRIYPSRMPRPHLRHILEAYASYYNEVRTHLSLDKDAPDFRRTQKIGPHRSHTNPRRPAPSIRQGLAFDEAQEILEV